MKEDDFTIPPPLPMEIASDFVLSKDIKGQEDVIGYMAGQASDEIVKHLEKIKSEKVLGTRYNVWDVVTDKGRWWVISSPMNLYSQEYFPSLDYTLSFHIGVMARVAADNRSGATDQEIFATAWRKWEQAAEASDQADEPEEYQAVGMRCRESLLAFIKEASNVDFVPVKKTAPKAGDFQAWIELIINAWAVGKSLKELRSYLKKTSCSVWQLVNWLTHATNAHPCDVRMAVEATEGVLTALMMAFFRHINGYPEKCTSCGSHQISSHFIEEKMMYQPYCPSCGWEGELYDDLK